MNLCLAVASSPLGSVRDGAKDVSCPQEGGRLMVSEAVGSSSAPASASRGAAKSLVACAVSKTVSKRRPFARSLDVSIDEAGGGDGGRGAEGSLDVYMDGTGGGDGGGGDGESSSGGADLGEVPLGRSHRTSPVELW